MRTWKIVRMIALVLFVATAVLTAVMSFMDRNSAKQIQASIDLRQKNVDQYQEQIQSTNLRYRGYQESMANIPDSTRKAQSGVLMKQMGEFQKQIRKLEYDQREASRLLRKEQRSKDAVDEQMRRRLLILGGVTFLLLVGFVVMSLRR